MFRELKFSRLFLYFNEICIIDFRDKRAEKYLQDQKFYHFQ